jgi:hypothetical protein
MSIVDNAHVTFHHGNCFSAEGVDAEPFATLTFKGLVDRDLIDAICQLIRESTNETAGDFCNIKLSTEDWDS